MEVVGLLHVLDPLVGLLLRIDTQTPSLGLGSQDTILTGGLISGETIDVPASDLDRVTHNLGKVETFTSGDILFLAENNQ